MAEQTPAATEEDALDPEGWDDAPPPRARGLMMRHPLLLVLVLAGAAFMFLKTWPRASYLLQAGEPQSCDISERPGLAAESSKPLPPLPHDRYCVANSHVDKLDVFATGEVDETVADPYRRHEGRRYYVKLFGDNVFAVLAADRKDVVDYRNRRGNLLGFEVADPGRMVDPAQDPGFQRAAQTLRLRFSIPEDAPIRIFDTTDHPANRWPYAAICVLMLFTALLALYGLVRMLRARLAAR